MLHFTKRVGSIYAIIDDEDGALDWASKADIEGYLKQGVKITGISKDMKTMEEQVVTLVPEKCNFLDGQNIFTNANSCVFAEKAGKFAISSAVDVTKPDGTTMKHAKRYKGVAEIQGDRVKLRFNNGVQTFIGLADYEVLVFYDVPEAVAVLNSLGNGVTPNRPAYS